VDAAQCLIVATDDARRDNLGFAAREGGWDVTLCGDVAAAVTQSRQRSLQMAIVDLSGPACADLPSFRFLVEQLACTSRMLLLVCGNVDDPREEVWARHLGVWMYLPGAIDGSELVGLCVAARETVERLTASNRQQRNGHGEMKFYRSS
jgi:DNA-binding response OmpR family regulator